MRAMPPFLPNQGASVIQEVVADARFLIAKGCAGYPDAVLGLCDGDFDLTQLVDEFAGAGDLVTASGFGRVELMAPFIPTLPGTDRYVEELRA